MDTLAFAFGVCQALGAVIGVGSAILGEIVHARALRDGKIDRAEHRHMEMIHKGLRFGMSVVLLASFGLVVAAYEVEATPQPVLTVSYWLLMIFAFVIIAASWAMARKAVSVTKGSVVAFTAWWFLALLTLGRLPITSIEGGVASFLIALLLFGLVISANRHLARRK